MPRPKSLPDVEILEATLRLMHGRGPESVTFAALSTACGLSSSTLVQRFANKPNLIRCTLLHAWDRLDAETEKLAASIPRTPEGAIRLLVGLSAQYGGIENYAEALPILREDLRDPVLRARGAKWKRFLCPVLDECFAGVPGVPDGMGVLMASQWQGSLLWWAFDPQIAVEAYVEEGLRRLVTVVSRGSDRAAPQDRR